VEEIRATGRNSAWPLRFASSSASVHVRRAVLKPTSHGEQVKRLGRKDRPFPRRTHHDRLHRASFEGEPVDGSEGEELARPGVVARKLNLKAKGWD
jgi:hypothetical protein